MAELRVLVCDDDSDMLELMLRRLDKMGFKADRAGDGGVARALIKDPAILILDEATAMFDPEGERGFIAECHELLSSRTVIIISHRPASLALADRVLRLEAGQLLEQSVVPFASAR
mgnify:CR=1 FL=1